MSEDARRHLEREGSTEAAGQSVKTASKGEYCETCDTTHDYQFDENDHYRSHTDWDKAYPKIGSEIYRGMAVQLSPETHAKVHGDAPVHERAKALLDEVTSKPLGMHWTDNSPEMAGSIAEDEAQHLQPRQRQQTTHVILHADKPAREHVEDDIRKLVQGSVISRHSGNPESEVPLKEGAPVNIWGISWKRHGDEGWHGHELEQPIAKTAGAKGETPELTFKHLAPEENHSYGVNQDTHTLHAHLPDGSHAGELSWFGEDGMIRDVDVHSDHRRKGIASELLRRAREIQPNVHHSDALTPEGKAWAEKVAVLEYFTAADEGDTDYRMQHRPPDADFGAPLHDLAKVYPEDIYTHPHYYDGGEPGYWEAHSIARRVKGQPDAKVTIYRALPAEYAHQGFRPGDWVSTSKEYARQHGMDHKGSDHDWPVIRTTVPAKHLQTNGDSLLEYGYTGPHKDIPMVSFKGGYHQEIRQGADGTVKPVKRRKPKTASDYRLQHRAPDEDSGKPYHEYFGGHEDDPVRIYRAAPHDVDYLDSDTWVTTNPDYAHLHAEQYDGSKKWPVMSAEVPAKHVYWDENDSNEFGYQGPRLEEHHLEEHDQEYGLKPFESQAPRRALVRKKKGPQQRWGIGVAHLTSQEHGDSLLHLDRSVALKAVDQALSGAQWSESSRESEDQAADRLNAARGHGPEGTRPVGVIMRAQDGKVDRVALRHHHDDLDSDHPFSGIEIHRSGSFHDLEQDARPMDKTATLIDYFGKAA